MANLLKLVEPTAVNRTVTPTRRPNAEIRKPIENTTISNDERPR